MVSGLPENQYKITLAEEGILYELTRCIVAINGVIITCSAERVIIKSNQRTFNTLS